MLDRVRRWLGSTTLAGGRIAALILAAVVVVSACTGGTSTGPRFTAAPGEPPLPTSDVILQGAGATFPATLYLQWFQEFNTRYPWINLDYTANGSGAGIKAVQQGTVDFGASDAAMKDSEIAYLPSGKHVLHVPTALGAVVLTANLPGVSGLRLDADAVAGIYLGSVKRWNDPLIAASNPGVALPDSAIVAIHRADSSGTTNAFTSYLATVSPTWKEKVGAGKDVQWPGGTGARGNDGIAAAVKQTPGAIGYVELSYAVKAKLPTVALKNAAGTYVAGSVPSTTAAAEAAIASLPADFRQKPIINGAGDQTYPIVSYTYILLTTDQQDLQQGRALIAFLQWALTTGQADEEALGYAPLPEAVRTKAVAALHTVTSGGSPIWP